MRDMTRTGVWTTLALVVALGTAACGSETDDRDAAGEAGVEVLSTCVQADECTSLEAEEFASLAAEDGVVLLDVRTPQEYAEGHLAGATNIDVSAPDFTARLADLDPDATYAVYCRSGNRSQTAMALMADAGLTHAADLAGGIGAWQSAGLDVTTD